jgi:hypothetical protein
MKKHGLAAAAVCIAIIGAMWVEWPEPAGDQVWAYQKLQPADYRLLHSDALGFVTAKAHEGFELHARHAGATSFEIRCKGVLVMDVENAPSRVLIRMPADARWRAPDIERLRISFERWLDLHQSQGRLLVESAGPSWVEARFGRFNGLVLDEQRCLLGAPAAARPLPPITSALKCPRRLTLTVALCLHRMRHSNWSGAKPQRHRNHFPIPNVEANARSTFREPTGALDLEAAQRCLLCVHLAIRACCAGGLGRRVTHGNAFQLHAPQALGSACRVVPR